MLKIFIYIYSVLMNINIMKIKIDFVNKSFHFERSSSNPLKNLSIGKRAQIIKWLDSFGITNYTINDDLTIDVNGDVELDYKSLTCFPSFIKFNKVSGNFYCSDNQLTSLVGCPVTVGGSFDCDSNQVCLRSLDHYCANPSHRAGVYIDS